MLHVITNITHGRLQHRDTVVGPRILRYTETSTGLAALEAKRYTRVLEIVCPRRMNLDMSRIEAGM